jgi:ribonucleotide monophosphatase NagD (HAD superfamily)
MPGTLARHYERVGGAAWLAGKPGAMIYEEALKELGLDCSEVLAVGDSAEHDILGAQRAGLDTLFVAGGIHAQTFERDGELALLANDVERFFEGDRSGPAGTPTYCMEYLKW